MLGTYFVTSEGGVLWLCDSHRTQKAIGFDAAARCPACTSTTNAIRSLAELSTCEKCRSPLVSIMHLAEGCEFACQRCGHSRLLNPCPLQLLARAMVSQEDLILEPSDGEPPPLPLEFAPVIDALARDGVHLNTHLHIEAMTAGFRAQHLAGLGPEAASLAKSMHVAPQAGPDLMTAEDLFRKGDHRRALQHYERAESIDPDSAIIKVHKGDALFALGKMQAAIECYQSALSIDPINHQAYRYLADAYVKLGKRSEAWNALIAAVLANPNYKNAWNDLAVIAHAARYVIHRHPTPKLAMPTLRVGGESTALLDATLQGRAPAIREAWESFGRVLAENLKRTPVDRWHRKRRRIADELAAWEALASSWQAARTADPRLKEESLDFVAKVHTDGMLDAFAFLEDFSEELRTDYEEWKRKHPRKDRLYLRNYVILPVGPAPP